MLIVVFTRACQAAAALVASSLAALPAHSASLDPNVTQSSYVFAASSITSMAWAPDGSNRLFLTIKGGQVRIVKDGALLATPFATETVYTNSECGLLGIAFDPRFADNGYVYLFRTASASEQQIVRYTANGDVGTSRVVLLAGLPTVGQNHDGGALGFGPDGKLYFAIGDNGNFTGVLSSLPVTNADLVMLAAKVGRANPDGSAPNDNPFFDGTGPNNDYVFARGFRNPFTLTFQPETGLLWVNSVGTSYEQVFITRRADHAGYRLYENNQPSPFLEPVIAYRTNGGGVATYTIAAGTGAQRSGGVATFTTTATHRLRLGERIFISGVADASFNVAQSAPSAYVASVPSSTTFTIAQSGPDATSGGGTVSTLLQANAAGTGAAISGGTFYEGTQFPASYRGNFFYGDYVSGRVMRATLAADNTITSVDYFADAVPTPIDLATGPDGALYLASYSGSILRFRYNATSQGIIVSHTNLRMAEGGRAAFSVRLEQAPASNVAVSVARTGGDADVSVASGSTLTFTPTSYATPQVVMLAAADDADSNEDVATVTTSSSGLVSRTTTVRVTDDDTSAFSISASNVNVPEGGSATFQVSLTSAPASNVTVSVANTGGDADVSVTSGATLTFTPTNYATPQTVTVSAAEDADSIDDAATLSVSTAGATPRTVAVTVTDNDAAAPQIVTAAPLRGVVGAPYTYDVNATGTPDATYSLDAPVPAGMTIDPATGVISWSPTTPGDFTVTVRAQNGVSPDATQTFTISVTTDAAPSCSITEPASGATISGTTAEFFGDGVDDVATTQAEFYVDDVLAYTDVNSQGHYHRGGGHSLFDTTAYADGAHTLRMVVTDTAGMTGECTASITIANGVDGGPLDAGADASQADASLDASISDASSDAAIGDARVDAPPNPSGDAGRDAAADAAPRTPAASSAEDEGCSCRTPSNAPRAPATALLALALLAFVHRRSRTESGRGGGKRCF